LKSDLQRTKKSGGQGKGRELTIKKSQMERMYAFACSLAELPSVRVGFLGMVDASPSPWNTTEKLRRGAAFLIVVTCCSSVLLLSPSPVGGLAPVWNSQCGA
jgi:hypothetical protein